MNDQKPAENRRAVGPGLLASTRVRAALVVLVLVGGAVYALQGWLARGRAIRLAGAEWAAYQRCLLGDEALAKDERPVTRMRRIEITLPEPGASQDPNSKAPEWPDRCQPHLEAIHAALVGTRLDTDPRFVHFDRLLQSAAQPHASLVPQYLDDRVIVDELWEAAHDTDLASAVPPKDERPAPAPAKPLEIWKLSPLASVGADFLPRGDPVPGASLHVLWPNEAGITYACTFGRGAGALASVRCQSLGIGRRWTSLATFATMDDDLKGFVVADSLPRAGLFAADSAKLLAADLDESSFVAKDGSIVGLRVRGERTLLVRVPQGGAATEMKLPPPARASDGYRLRLDTLVTTEPGDASQDRLVLRKVASSDATLAAPADAGPVGANVNAVSACRTGEALVLAVKSGAESPDATGEHPVQSRITMVFRVGDRWLAPVEGSAAWTSRGGDVSWGNAVLTCRGREGTLTWRTDDEVRQLRCAPEGCKVGSSGPLKLPGVSVDVDAADLDGKVILTRVVKATTPLSGTTYSLRMRLAPVADVAKAPDIVLLGDEKHEGMALSGAADLYVRGDAAVILVRDDKVLRGVRVTTEGKFEGLKLEAAN